MTAFLSTIITSGLIAGGIHVHAGVGLVYHFTENCESGRQLLTNVSTAEPELALGEVKRSTFFDAFQRFPVVWFANMLSYLLATVILILFPVSIASF